MVLPRARSALSSAMLCSLWFHFRRTGQARATACASTVSHDAFLITLPSSPPPPRRRSTSASAVFSSSECRGGDDALATLFLARTHHAWPWRGPTFTPVPRPNPQRPNPQRGERQRSRSAPPQRLELGSSTDTAKPRGQQPQNLTALASVPSVVCRRFLRW